MPKTQHMLLMVIAVTALLSYRVLQNSSVDQSHIKPDQTIHVRCPLQFQTCSINVGELKLDLMLTPKGLPALEKLNLEIVSKGSPPLKLDQFEAWFEGRDMKMGRHYFGKENLFSQNETGKSTLTASGMIPVCSIDSAMTWQLNINFVFQNKLTQLQFEMSSAPHSENQML